MQYVVIDLETNIKNPIGNNKGSSHCPENKIVYMGMKFSGEKEFYTHHFSPGVLSLRDSGLSTREYRNAELLIGHNIKFDLLYLLRYTGFREQLLPNVLIWDTALVEFLITGQEHKFPSLNECATKYGGTVKNDKIKEMWDAGIDTDDIDVDLMKEYLTGDVRNTELIFLEQFKHCKENGLLPLVWSQMAALKATTMMEHNGMKVDTRELIEYKYLKEKELGDFRHAAIKLLIEDLHPQLMKMEWGHIEQFLNLDSPQFISKVLYGGTCEYQRQVSDGVYKTGKKKGLARIKNVTEKVQLVAFTPPKEEHKTAKAGIYKVGEEELREELLTSGIKLTAFIACLLKIRELSKEVGTYIEGIGNLIYEDGCIHGNLQHTVAVTGRLTSSNPNLQNFTSGDD